MPRYVKKPVEGPTTEFIAAMWCIHDAAIRCPLGEVETITDIFTATYDKVEAKR